MLRVMGINIIMVNVVDWRMFFEVLQNVMCQLCCFISLLIMMYIFYSVMSIVFIAC